MGEDTKAASESEADDKVRQMLQIAGQCGEVLAFIRGLRLERFKDSSRVQDQHLRDREDVLQRLAETDDPTWWIEAKAQDVLGIFEASSAWKNDSEAASEADKRLRQRIQERYEIGAVALDTTPPWDAHSHEAK